MSSAAYRGPASGHCTSLRPVSVVRLRRGRRYRIPCPRNLHLDNYRYDFTCLAPRSLKELSVDSSLCCQR
ncbi:hypothetical protein BS78_07G068200 [Paspalum vaginatum]|nr:hypothetical protein BS78_07G068200 [Paspalum vaginatum]